MVVCGECGLVGWCFVFVGVGGVGVVWLWVLLLVGVNVAPVSSCVFGLMLPFLINTASGRYSQVVSFHE